MIKETLHLLVTADCQCV